MITNEMKANEPKLILKKTFVENTYVPDKKELCELIMRDEVSICIMSQSKYDNGIESMMLRINHS